MMIHKITNGLKMIRKPVYAGFHPAGITEHPGWPSCSILKQMKFSSTYAIIKLWSSFSQIAVDTRSSKSIRQVIEERFIKMPESGG